MARPGDDEISLTAAIASATDPFREHALQAEIEEHGEEAVVQQQARILAAGERVPGIWELVVPTTQSSSASTSTPGTAEEPLPGPWDQRTQRKFVNASDVSQSTVVRSPERDLKQESWIWKLDMRVLEASMAELIQKRNNSDRDRFYLLDCPFSVVNCSFTRGVMDASLTKNPCTIKGLDGHVQSRRTGTVELAQGTVSLQRLGRTTLGEHPLLRQLQFQRKIIVRNVHIIDDCPINILSMRDMITEFPALSAAPSLRNVMTTGVFEIDTSAETADLAIAATRTVNSAATRAEAEEQIRRAVPTEEWLRSAEEVRRLAEEMNDQPVGEEIVDEVAQIKSWDHVLLLPHTGSHIGVPLDSVFIGSVRGSNPQSSLRKDLERLTGNDTGQIDWIRLNSVVMTGSDWLCHHRDFLDTELGAYPSQRNICWQLHCPETGGRTMADTAKVQLMQAMNRWSGRDPIVREHLKGKYVPKDAVLCVRPCLFTTALVQFVSFYELNSRPSDPNAFDDVESRVRIETDAPGIRMWCYWFVTCVLRDLIEDRDLKSCTVKKERCYYFVAVLFWRAVECRYIFFTQLVGRLYANWRRNSDYCCGPAFASELATEPHHWAFPSRPAADTYITWNAHATQLLISGAGHTVDSGETRPVDARVTLRTGAEVHASTYARRRLYEGASEAERVVLQEAIARERTGVNTFVRRRLYEGAMRDPRLDPTTRRMEQEETRVVRSHLVATASQHRELPRLTDHQILNLLTQNDQDLSRMIGNMSIDKTTRLMAKAREVVLVPQIRLYEGVARMARRMVNNRHVQKRRETVARLNNTPQAEVNRLTELAKESFHQIKWTTQNESGDDIVRLNVTVLQGSLFQSSEESKEAISSFFLDHNAQIVLVCGLQFFQNDASTRDNLLQACAARERMVLMTEGNNAIILRHKAVYERYKDELSITTMELSRRMETPGELVGYEIVKLALPHVPKDAPSSTTVSTDADADADFDEQADTSLVPIELAGKSTWIICFFQLSSGIEDALLTDENTVKRVLNDMVDVCLECKVDLLVGDLRELFFIRSGDPDGTNRFKPQNYEFPVFHTHLERSLCLAVNSWNRAEDRTFTSGYIGFQLVTSSLRNAGSAVDLADGVTYQKVTENMTEGEIEMETLQRTSVAVVISHGESAHCMDTRYKTVETLKVHRRREPCKTRDVQFAAPRFTGHYDSVLNAEQLRELGDMLTEVNPENTRSPLQHGIMPMDYKLTRNKTLMTYGPGIFAFPQRTGFFQYPVSFAMQGMDLKNDRQRTQMGHGRVQERTLHHRNLAEARREERRAQLREVVTRRVSDRNQHREPQSIVPTITQLEVVEGSQDVEMTAPPGLEPFPYPTSPITPPASAPVPAQAKASSRTTVVSTTGTNRRLDPDNYDEDLDFCPPECQWLDCDILMTSAAVTHEWPNCNITYCGYGDVTLIREINQGHTINCCACERRFVPKAPGTIKNARCAYPNCECATCLKCLKDHDVVWKGKYICPCHTFEPSHWLDVKSHQECKEDVKMEEAASSMQGLKLDDEKMTRDPKKDGEPMYVQIGVLTSSYPPQASASSSTNVSTSVAGEAERKRSRSLSPEPEKWEEKEIRKLQKTGVSLSSDEDEDERMKQGADASGASDDAPKPKIKLKAKPKAKVWKKLSPKPEPPAELLHMMGPDTVYHESHHEMDPARANIPYITTQEENRKYGEVVARDRKRL